MNPSQKQSVLQAVAEDSSNVAVRLSVNHGITRQAASAWLRSLKNEGLITSTGHGRGVRYQLATLSELNLTYAREGLSESRVWSESLSPALRDLPENVFGIWHYVATEMINNAIDHSGSATVSVYLRRDPINTYLQVSDTGEGIFLKIQKALDLWDARESILELAKGKLTTDPSRHTGEGIFFSSKATDRFDIISGNLHFTHEWRGMDWLLDRQSDAPGTRVMMCLANDSDRTLKSVFDFYAEPDEFTFAKTVVPVRLAQHEGEKLISRSQAKRLTLRFERFQKVVLDFSGVEEIGQAFADEVFRVFQNAHPNTSLIPINMTDAVRNMFTRATSTNTNL